MNQPLVSVIVTTKNNHETLDACLSSISKQTYRSLELVVVDNSSSDDTKEIAARYTNRVFNKGPERSAQRNFAVQKAKGEIVAIIDSDMELEPEVMAQCVKAIAQAGVVGVIIPEESFGRGFWAQCKKLERSFYQGMDSIEAARVFKRQTYLQVGGYDQAMVSGEDWDLSKRVGQQGKLARIAALIHHNEGDLRLWRTLKKKVYYAGQARQYLAKNPQSKFVSDQGPLARYKLFLSRPSVLLRQPITSIGMLFMKTCEYAFGAIGYILAGKEKA